MKAIILIGCLLAVAARRLNKAAKIQATPSTTTELPRLPRRIDLSRAREYFDRFVAEYDRRYSGAAEREKRFRIFSEHLRKINRLNEEQPQALFGINKFADLSSAEFWKDHGGYGFTTTEATTHPPKRKKTKHRLRTGLMNIHGS